MLINGGSTTYCLGSVYQQAMSTPHASSSKQIVWALGKLRYRPTRAWAASLEARVTSLLRALGPQGLTCVLHAMAWMGCIPTRRFIEVCDRR